ncbi:DUF5011 domain-containing protein [Candidatus Nomurabacteria bacterium]|nr:DUF5011 domain-containing protein [Candidatus Nomurabacteria bacterium]
MNFKVLLIFAILSLFTFNSKAVASESCSVKGYSIFTINGMLNDEIAAIKNKNKLKSKFGTTFNNQPLIVDYLYNPTHLAGLNDYIDVIQQGLFDQQSDYDLVEMINDASGKVKTQKLLLVAHSQGNFYANNFYDKTASQQGGVPKESIGVYGVASPANRVAGGGKYLTSDTDNVIAAVVGRYIKILKPNIHIPLEAKVDGNGHSFSDVYLKYQGVRIVSDIKSALSKLKENDEQLAEEPCISAPELSLGHKIQGVVLAVADPAAGAVKTGLAASYNAGAYVRDKAVNAGSFAGNILRNTGLSLKNTVKGLTASVADSLPDASSLTTGLPNTANAENENNNNTITETQKEETENAAPSLPENSDKKENDSVNIDAVGETADSKDKPRRNGGGGGGSESLPTEQQEELPPETGEVIPPAEEVPVVPAVTDTIPPVISVLGDNPVEILKDTVYADAGATALDETDGVINVLVTGAVDSAVVGAYTITYTATDLSSNISTAARTVNVVAPVPAPVPVPAPLDTLTISENTTLVPGEYSYDNLIITNNAVLTLEGDSESAGSFKGVKITAVNLTVDSGASISANAKGYMDGPGAPSSEYAGASYGGVGDRNISTSTYGSAKNPVDLGSGGFGNFHGGGAIKLLVSNVLANNGIISANGDPNSSGGSIYATAKTLEGSGKFSANGGGFFLGSNIYGSGSGGRIAIYYENSSFTGDTEAKGGCGSYNSYTPVCGENGTVGFFDELADNFYAESSWKFMKEDGPFSFDKIFISNGAKVSGEEDVNISADEILIDESSSFTLADGLILNVPVINIDGESTLALSGEETINAENLALKGNSTITIIPEKILYLDISNITIESGSSISANGKGYVDGPGAPSSEFAGASYGGKGAGAIPGPVYGSETEPVDFGSGGTNYYHGGGAIRLKVDGIFVNDGIISTSGEATSSGGSIYVTANNLQGSGTFSANGGGNHFGSMVYGAGGGGRVAIYYKVSPFSGETLASGANAGTIKLIDTSIPEPDPEPEPAPAPEPDPLPDTTLPEITSYTFNGSSGDVTINPIANPLALAFTASENVDWVSVKIENEDDASFYKIFLSGTRCVDGTNTCLKTWDGILSSGGLLQDGTFRIKMHIKDSAGNEFYDYLANKIIVDLP